MAQKGRGQLFGINAVAVVSDPQIGQSAVLDFHHNGGGPGVDGVLQQLLGHAGGAPPHLTGGNEVRHVAGQALNIRHRALLS